MRNPQAWPTLAPSSRYCSPITTNPNNHRATVCHKRGRRPSFHRTTRIPNANFAKLPRNSSVPSTWLANDTASTHGTSAPRNPATPSEAGKTRCDNVNPTISATRASVVAARARRFSPASSGTAARGAGDWPRGRLRLGPGRVAFTRRIVAQLGDCPQRRGARLPRRWRCGLRPSWLKFHDVLKYVSAPAESAPTSDGTTIDVTPGWLRAGDDTQGLPPDAAVQSRPGRHRGRQHGAVQLTPAPSDPERRMNANAQPSKARSGVLTPPPESAEGHAHYGRCPHRSRRRRLPVVYPGMTYCTWTESGEWKNSLVVTDNSMWPGPEGMVAELYHEPTSLMVVLPRAPVSMLRQEM